jgi:hypothetical protein
MATTTKIRPASPKQIDFLRDLANGRQAKKLDGTYDPGTSVAQAIEITGRTVDSWLAEFAAGTKAVSPAIDRLLVAPRMPKAGGPAKAALPPVGLYVTDADGVIRKVYTTQTGRTAAKRLIVQETESGDFKGRFEFEKGAQYKLAEALAAGSAHALTEDEAKAFGKMYAFCCNCGIDLNEDRSIAAGYGPVCAGHRGWHYPTKAEAAEILGHPA